MKRYDRNIIYSQLGERGSCVSLDHEPYFQVVILVIVKYIGGQVLSHTHCTSFFTVTSMGEGRGGDRIE